MSFFKNLLARSDVANRLLGPVSYEGNVVRGMHRTGFLQWRIKAQMAGDQRFVSLKIEPSYSVTKLQNASCYVDFDLVAARAVMAELEEAIGLLEAAPKAQGT